MLPFRLVLLAFITGQTYAATESPCQLRDLYKVKDDIRVKNEATILSESEEQAATSRAAAAESLLGRIRKLAEAHSVTEIRLREAERDNDLAQLRVKKEHLNATVAGLEKRRSELEAGCLEGKPPAPSELAQIYEQLGAARKGLAEVTLESAKAKLAYEEFEMNGLKALAAQGAIDPAVALEAEYAWRARQEEVTGAKTALEAWSH